MSVLPPFSRLVVAAMTRRGLGLRELCRRARLDPSFLSKVLAGKRNPPNAEDVLRRLAAALEIDPVELVVAAGRLPEKWKAMTVDSGLLRRVDAMASSARPSSASFFSPKPFSEELL